MKTHLSAVCISIFLLFAVPAGTSADSRAYAPVKSRMDKIVVAFKAANPDFVDQYFANRIIVDPSTSATRLTGTVTAAATGLPVAGADIEAVSNNKFGPKTTGSATSDAKGKYAIKPLPPVTYNVTVTVPGF